MMRAVIFALQTIVVLIFFTVCAVAIAFVAQFLSILNGVPFFIIVLGAALLLALSMAPHLLKNEGYDCTTCKISKKTFRA